MLERCQGENWYLYQAMTSLLSEKTECGYAETLGVCQRKDNRFPWTSNEFRITSRFSRLHCCLQNRWQACESHQFYIYVGIRKIAPCHFYSWVLGTAWHCRFSAATKGLDHSNVFLPVIWLEFDWYWISYSHRDGHPTRVRCAISSDSSSIFWHGAL